MPLIFWLSIGCLIYVYLGYPLLLALVVRLRRPARPAGAERVDDATLPPTRAAGPSAPLDLPGVTIVVAARNEAARLAGRIDNLLSLDYPMDRLQIVISDDGSTDGTRDVVMRYAPRVCYVAGPPRGKAAALNAGVAQARHPVLLFADARQLFAPDAVTRLVARLRDPRVGAVSGELVLDCESETAGRSRAADGLGAYWRYEKWLRRQESCLSSTLGVTGAIYALRRDLWRPLQPDTILDDVLVPMRAVLDGYRVVFEAGAIARDTASPDAAAELGRKVRTLAGNFQLVAREPRLLVPGLNPVWWQFVSHKLGRLVAPYALVTWFAASVALAPTGLVYALACGGQCAFYALAVYGALLDRRSRQARAHPGEVIREAA